MEMESPNTASEKRPRKRSKRLSASDVILPEEPVKKKVKRVNAPVGESVKGVKETKLKTTQKGSPVGSSKTKRGRTSRDKESKSSRISRSRTKKLLVSLNFAENDLLLSGVPLSNVQAMSPSTSIESKSSSRHSRYSQQSSSRLRAAESINGDSDAMVTNNNGHTPNGDGGSAPFIKRCAPMNFKNPKFTFSYLSTNKKKTWKNMKQIIAAEKALGYGPNDPSYSSIDAPPALKPPKKYSDMSGLTAKYTDPLTSMYFNTTDEFQLIRKLPSDVIQSYLALRGKMTIA